MTIGPDLLVAALENEGVAQGEVLVVWFLGWTGGGARLLARTPPFVPSNDLTWWFAVC